MNKHLVAGVALLTLCACGHSTSFDQVEGGLRIQGTLDRDNLHPERDNVVIRVLDAGSGHPVDADVALRPQGEGPQQASRSASGTYAASIDDAQKIDVLVVTQQKAAQISLLKQ